MNGMKEEKDGRKRMSKRPEEITHAISFLREFASSDLTEKVSQYIDQLEEKNQVLMGLCIHAYSELLLSSPNCEFLDLLENESPKWMDEEIESAREKVREMKKVWNKNE